MVELLVRFSEYTESNPFGSPSSSSANKDTLSATYVGVSAVLLTGTSQSKIRPILQQCVTSRCSYPGYVLNNNNLRFSLKSSLLGERNIQIKEHGKGRTRSRHGPVASVSEGESANTLQRTGTQDLGEVQIPNNVEVLKAALAAAEKRALAAEKAEKQALEALAAEEAKSEEYTYSFVNNTEEATIKIEAVKNVFRTELDKISKSKAEVDHQLLLAKQDGIELALQVERIAESAILEVTFKVTEEAKMRVAEAETAAAEAVSQVENRLRRAADDAATSVVMDARSAIEGAVLAADTAKVQAQTAQTALNEQLGLLDELAKAEAKVLSLEEALLTGSRQLRVAIGETERLEIELDAAQGYVKAATARVAAAEAVVLQVQKIADKAAQEREGSAQRAIEVVTKAAKARKEADQIAFKSKLEALEAMNSAAQNANEARTLANKSRYEALERSLVASEAVASAWKNRALAAEEVLRQIKESGIEIMGRNRFAEQISAGNRLGNDSRIKDLFENGPRSDTPEWMRRRIEAGQQGLPPMRPVSLSGEVEAVIPLQLPSPEDVWSVANAKVKEDIYTAQAAEKEALDLQRKALEKALQTKSPKKLVSYPEDSENKLESGTGTGREIVFQGFNWESWRRSWWLELSAKAADLSQCGITTIWLPPPTQSVAPQGYMPGDLYNMNSAYGTEDELKQCIEEMHTHNLQVLGDVVLNHRCAQAQNSDGIWNVYGGKLAWGPEAIVRDDPNFQGLGNLSSGDIFHAAPNVDHSQDFVREDIKVWMQWLRNVFKFDGWRLDFVRGFWGGHVKEYIESTNPAFAIGEYWDSLSYEDGQVSYNQDSHRQRIINWINAAGGTSSAFDVTTKGILHSALHGEFWRLIDPQGKPPGVMGWWPSRAVTFLENHDTGSTQGHWPFPRDKLMMGYAYILTHPGTPVIFYDHFYDFGLHDPIAELIAVRNRTGVHCRSPVNIFQANFEGYVAQVGDNLVMKIGHLDWNPSKQINLAGSWERCVDKGEYQIWERQ